MHITIFQLLIKHFNLYNTSTMVQKISLQNFDSFLAFQIIIQLHEDSKSRITCIVWELVHTIEWVLKFVFAVSLLLQSA